MLRSLAVAACCLLPALSLAATVEPTMSDLAARTTSLRIIEDAFPPVTTVASRATEILTAHALTGEGVLSVSHPQLLSPDKALAPGTILIDFKLKRHDTRLLYRSPPSTRTRGEVSIYEVAAPSSIATMLAMMITLFLVRSGAERRRRLVYHRCSLQTQYVRYCYPVSALFRFSSSFSRKPMVVSQP